MSLFIVALMFGVGAASFIWTKLVRTTGNADPKTVLTSAGAAGLLAFFVFYSLFAWVFHI